MTLSLLSLEQGDAVTLEQIKAVPVPEETKSWKPVPYGELIDYLKLQVEQKLKLQLLSEQYGLNSTRTQMFAVLVFETDSNETGMAFGLRQSYNKSLSAALAAGFSSVFVCDNLCLSGDAFKVLRRNTVNVWTDFQKLVSEQLDHAHDHYIKMEAHKELMQCRPCPQDRGFELLGRALGHQVLTPTQASVAFEDWRQPRHEDFSERTMWSLYNCCTEGLKKGAPGTAMERHAQAHGFFVEALRARSTF